MVSKGFGLPFAGKCINTGAVLIRNLNNKTTMKLLIFYGEGKYIYILCSLIGKYQIPHQSLQCQNIMDSQSVYENNDMNLQQL